MFCKAMVIFALLQILNIIVCSAALYTPGDDFIFEKDTPLIITCISAKNESNINFKFDNTLLGTCYSLFGCITQDTRFSISAVTSTFPTEYFLKSVNNFDTTLCGTYRCTDIPTDIQDAVNVSYKEFNNNSFLVEERDDALYISTACVFPASYTDLEVSWFMFDNSSLTELNITTVDGFITVVNSTSGCPDVTCNNISAKRFTFGLTFNNNSKSFSSAFVEIKIIHTLFQDKPLVWRSSRTYSMEEKRYIKHISSPAKHAGLSVGSIIGIVVGVVAFVSIMAVLVICIQLRNKRKRSKDVGRSKKGDVSTFKKSQNFETESEKTESDIGVITSKDNETGGCVSPLMADSKRQTAVSVEQSINADTDRGNSNHHETDASNFNSKHSETDDETDIEISTPNGKKTETDTLNFKDNEIDISKREDVIRSDSDDDAEPGSCNSTIMERETSFDKFKYEKTDTDTLNFKENEIDISEREDVIRSDSDDDSEPGSCNSYIMERETGIDKFNSENSKTGYEEKSINADTDRGKSNYHETDDASNFNSKHSETDDETDIELLTPNGKKTETDTLNFKDNEIDISKREDVIRSDSDDDAEPGSCNSTIMERETSIDKFKSEKTDTDTLNFKDHEIDISKREDVIRSDSDDNAEPVSCNSTIMEREIGIDQFKPENSKTGYEEKLMGVGTVCNEIQDVIVVGKSKDGQIGKLNNDENDHNNESATNCNNYQTGNENSNLNGNKTDTDKSKLKDIEIESAKVKNVISTE